MRGIIRSPFVRLTAAGLALGLLAGCDSSTVVGDYPEGRPGSPQQYYKSESDRESIFGADGINIFGGDKKNRRVDRGGGIGVNAYLWRASLDTISFMPVNSADAFGGVIITDWHSPSGEPNERFKMNVYILGRALRADGVRVSVFRQVQGTNGAWRDATLPELTATKIEDSILTRARQLRSESLQQ